MLQNELDFVKFISEWVASLYKCTDPQPFFWKRNEITLKHIVDMMQTVTIAKRQDTTRTDAVQSQNSVHVPMIKKIVVSTHKKTQAKCKYRVVT